MAKVPITVMGYRCERCAYEWIPKNFVNEPRVCPKCKSPYWDRPKKRPMTYDQFRAKIAATLRASDHPLTWTEIRTNAQLPQAFPNNKWVHRLEQDINLLRAKDMHGIMQWRLKKEA